MGARGCASQVSSCPKWGGVGIVSCVPTNKTGLGFVSRVNKNSSGKAEFRRRNRFGLNCNSWQRVAPQSEAATIGIAVDELARAV